MGREHPMQALLDAYVIQAELGRLDGLTVTLVGDLLNSRSAHSLTQLLSNFDVKLNLVAPPSLGLPAGFEDAAMAIAASRGALSMLAPHDDISAVVGETDVLYYA